MENALNVIKTFAATMGDTNKIVDAATKVGTFLGTSAAQLFS